VRYVFMPAMMFRLVDACYVVFCHILTFLFTTTLFPRFFDLLRESNRAP
jgi:hypothetical protein